MKLFPGILMAVLAIAVVTLGMTTLAYSKRAQDVSTQLDRARDELRELRGFRRRTPLSWEDSLREFAGEREVPYARFRGWNAPMPGRFAGFTEERDRRRQALDRWFEQTIADLNQRAQSADSKEA